MVMARKTLEPPVKPALRQAVGSSNHADLFVNDVELGAFELKLKINKHALDDELIAQPALFYDVAERLADAVSRRDEAKDNLEVIEAGIYLDLRHAADERQEKATEATIKAKVTVSQERRRGFDELLRIEREVARLQALREGIKDRSFMLRYLCDMQRDAYFAHDSESSDRNRGNRADGYAAMQTRRNR